MNNDVIANIIHWLVKQIVTFNTNSGVLGCFHGGNFTTKEKNRDHPRWKTLHPARWGLGITLFHLLW